MSTPTTPESSRPLHPDMVYRAISPPRTTFPRDDGDDKPHKFRLHVIGVARFIVLVLACVAFGFSVDNAHFAPVLLAILLMLLVLWNALQIALTICGGKDGKFRFPTFVCQIGSWKCSCGGEEDEILPTYRDNREPPKRLPLPPTERVDLGLLVAILIISFIAHDDWHYGWRAEETLFPLVWTVVALEGVIVLLSHFKVFRGVTVFVMTDENAQDPYRYHIQLPQEVQTTPAQGKGLSVHA